VRVVPAHQELGADLRIRLVVAAGDPVGGDGRAQQT
jgi:hypothetical protein